MQTGRSTSIGVVLIALISSATGARADGDGAAARKILTERCGGCHDGKAAKPSPMALKVFNVAEEQWWIHLTDRQLPKLMGRMGSAPAGEKAAVAAFIAGEQERRRKQPPR